ncbi:MAG: sensor histidine kinase KdpD [Acidobacteriota bacterium]
MNERRPSPEEMLARADEAARAATRGRLKIFFGAAPGVGKTYAMLQDARARQAEGRDVVLGWVESHGRSETEVLTQGLEQLPPRQVEYRGVALREFDLDAALIRRPSLLVLDELAHTNAEGSRHARRWQDVEELLDAGIDVYTSLNVQHVESLNDVVAQITGVVVRETVPDSLLDEADQIELIDLPSEELLQRLAEGKVYIPQQAERAVRGFFRKGNLIALRELSLRRTAERVDAQATRYKRDAGIAQPWAIRERILAAIGPAPQSANLIRAACRMATRLQAPWIVLLVESTRYDNLPKRDHESVARHLALAERLGAEIAVVRGESVGEEILALARARNVTRILVGKPTHSRWRDRLRGSLIDTLVRGSGTIDVLVTRGDEDQQPGGSPVSAVWQSGALRASSREYLIAAAVVLATTGFNLLLAPYVELADETMIYLLSVVGVASRLSRGPSLFAAAGSVAALDFFFVPPRLTFVVQDFRHVLTFAIMLVVGVIVSTLTLRIRDQAASARERERRTAGLYALSRDLGARRTSAEIADVAARHAESLLGTDCVVLCAGNHGELTAHAGAARHDMESEHELAVARWVLEHGRPAGFETGTLPGTRFTYLPITGAERVLGVFAFALGHRPEQVTPSQRQLAETIVAQTALALGRAWLSNEAEEARLAAETEGVRNALLSAVSHDLRTPLATIHGASGVLLDVDAPLREEGRRELLETIHLEAQRLGRLVNDLLELSRLESNPLQIAKQWYPIEELVRSGVSRLERLLRDRPLTIRLPETVLTAPVEPILIEQVVVNLLDNALKYTPDGTPLEIEARRIDDQIEISVLDRGPGIPGHDAERIFEKFYRGGADLNVRGTGLGLALCQAVAKAHGGTIWAENREGGGAAFRMRLPAANPPDDEEPTEP